VETQEYKNAAGSGSIFGRARKSDREAKKVEKEAIDLEWKRLQAAHERDVEAWRMQCESLSHEKVPKSCHPKKPQ
jgi:hypothetical protein